MLLRIIIVAILLMLYEISSLGSLPVLADSPLTFQQTFPYQPGFPSDDPNGDITFASPSVVDLDGDGQWEILTADGAGCVWAWDDHGSVIPGFPWTTAGSCSGAPRIIGPLAIGDIDGDGKPEVVAGTRGASNNPGERGRVFVWRNDGSILPGWPQEMVWNLENTGSQAEIYSVVLGNVVGDPRLEVLAGTTNSSVVSSETSYNPNLYAWHANGSPLPGYPTWWRGAGIFGQIGASDITGDGLAEVIAGRDHPYLYAYDAQGQHLSGWPVFTFVEADKTSWNADPYIEFTNNAPAIGDLDQDGTVEIVIAGKVRSPTSGHNVVKSAILVVEPNGQRRAGWEIPRLGGGPLHGSFPPSQAPALADLDGDGKLEIVVALFDGTIRAYRENGALVWTYNYAQEKKLFGSEPVIGDVTGDGALDIIFGTYSPDGSANNHVALHGLDASGRPLANFPLPLTHEGNKQKNGIRAAPTLADIDRDCDVEILAGSRGNVMYVWDLPASYNPDLMPWPTGRHDNYRTGAVNGFSYSIATTGDLSDSDLSYALYLPILGRSC